jgi:steroid delta-isomerase-like uncharacterized protein
MNQCIKEEIMHKIHTYTVLMSLLFAMAMMSPAATPNKIEKNKAVARRLFEVALTLGKWDVYEEIHSKDFVAHSGKKSAGLAEDLEFAKGWHQAAPDLVFTVDQMVAEGDMVTVRFTGRGTNTGTGNGLPATGRRVEASGITIFHIVNGKIVEEWGVSDMLSVLKQLGLFPANG